MSGPTPGPWRQSAGSETTIFSAEGGRRIAEAQCGGMTQVRLAEAEANARLIAAAPEMREALISARNALASAVIEASGGMFDADTVGKHLVIAQIDAALTLSGDKS